MLFFIFQGYGVIQLIGRNALRIFLSGVPGIDQIHVFVHGFRHGAQVELLQKAGIDAVMARPDFHRIGIQHILAHHKIGNLRIHGAHVVNQRFVRQRGYQILIHQRLQINRDGIAPDQIDAALVGRQRVCIPGMRVGIAIAALDKPDFNIRMQRLEGFYCIHKVKLRSAAAKGDGQRALGRGCAFGQGQGEACGCQQAG